MMTARRIMMTMMMGFFCAGAAMAAPEPTPKELSGVIAGKLTAKERGKITVKNEEHELTLMPHWRGGMPKDGGGFDKEIMAKLEEFKVGDMVKVNWEFMEHYRILKIERIEKRRE